MMMTLIELLEEDLPRAQTALGAIGSSYRGLGQWTNSDVRMGRFFFWGRDGRFSESVDVFLREGRPLRQLEEFPSGEEVFPLRRVAFHNISLPAPSGAKPFLERCYGRWADEVVVWSHSSSSRRMHRLSLQEYMEGVTAAGYVAPMVSDPLRADLSVVGLDSAGDLRQTLWKSLGWASPWPLEDAEDALDMLGLEERCWLLGEGCGLGMQLKNWLLKDEAECLAAVERVKLMTGCFLELTADTTDPALKRFSMLRAVGGSTELSAVEPAFGEIFAS